MGEHEPVWLFHTAPETLPRRNRRRPILVSAITLALLAAATGAWAARPDAIALLTVPVAGAMTTPTASSTSPTPDVTTATSSSPEVTVTSVVTVTATPTETAQPTPAPAPSTPVATPEGAATSDISNLPDNGDVGVGNPAGQAVPIPPVIPVPAVPKAPVTAPDCPTMAQIGGTLTVVGRAPYPGDTYNSLVTIEVKYNNPRRYPVYLNGTISYASQYADLPLTGWKNGEMDAEPRDVELRPGPGSFRLQMLDIDGGITTARLKWSGWQLAPGPGEFYFSDNSQACAMTSQDWAG